MPKKYILTKEITNTEPAKEKLVKFIYCEASILKRFKSYCASEGKFLSKTVDNLLEKYLDKCDE